MTLMMALTCCAAGLAVRCPTAAAVADLTLEVGDAERPGRFDASAIGLRRLPVRGGSIP
jgi:hypothetical protein